VEADHLDNYGTEEAYRASFRAFIDRIAPGGLLVTSADDPGTAELAAHARGLGRRVVTYGESPHADYLVTDVAADGMPTMFSLTMAPRSSETSGADRGQPNPFGPMNCELGVPGLHNALNGAAALAAAVELGIAPDVGARALASYRGAARRLEPKGE